MDSTNQESHRNRNTICNFIRTYSTKERLELSFLGHIITSDENWYHHYKLETKEQSMEWWRKFPIIKKKFTTQPQQVKWCALFLRQERSYISDISGFHRAWTNHQLWPLHNDADEAEASNFQNQARETSLLHHSSTRASIGLNIVEHTASIFWTFLPHPPYCPHLVPFSLFPSLLSFLASLLSFFLASILLRIL